MASKDIKTQVQIASYYIASNGRMGSATNIIISHKNYYKYELNYHHKNLEPYFDESIEDIILYRKNNFEQPGLVLVCNDDKYSIDRVGLHPENQFFKIRFLNILRNYKLDRII
jgi:hypothetical protein